MGNTRLSLISLLVAFVATGFASGVAAASPNDVPAYVTKAIMDPAREADRADDQRRQMAAVMTFTGVKPGDKVMELVPGRGYWTRVFSGIVGDKGHVYTVWPKETMRFASKSFDKWKELSKSSPYTNVSVTEEPAADPVPAFCAAQGAAATSTETKSKVPMNVR